MPKTIKCTTCNSQNAEGLNFCTTCGTRIGFPCPECGAIVPPDSRYCPSCAFLCGSGRFGKMQHKVEATQQVIKCPNCSAQVSSGRRFCTACGAKLQIPCPQCGTMVEPTAGHCTKCGYIGTMHNKENKK